MFLSALTELQKTGEEDSEEIETEVEEAKEPNPKSENPIKSHQVSKPPPAPPVPVNQAAPQAKKNIKGMKPTSLAGTTAASNASVASSSPKGKKEDSR